LDKAVELGANYVAVSTPYDNPDCGNSVDYTRTWVNAIRAHNLKVWHRHMPLAFESIYSTPKSNASDFKTMIVNYIHQNPDLFADEDIFTPIPEPQNGGIFGVTGCVDNICQFSSIETFNQWLRDIMTVSKDSFTAAGKNLKIGYFGFDGYIAWGDNNPDWDGILEDATILQMGNITIDHYPELVGDTMDNDLTELEQRYPGVDIVIGEWGTATGLNTPQQVINSMGAAANHPSVKGFNYWQFGPGGAGEQLINDDFTNNTQFAAVSQYYSN
jgi:hypothetical protein